MILVFTWGIAFATRKPGGLAAIIAHSWMFLVLSGLSYGAVVALLFPRAAVGPASRVAPVDKLSVAFVILFAALFLGEGLSPVKAVGGLLITAGAVVLALA